MSRFVVGVLMGILWSGASGCSSWAPLAGEQQAGMAPDARSPQILSVRLEQERIALDARSIDPEKSLEIFAQLHERGTEAVEVRLVFLEVPIEILLSRVGDGGWRGALGADHLKQLLVPQAVAVYHARLWVRDRLGILSIADSMVSLAVQDVTGRDAVETNKS